MRTHIVRCCRFFRRPSYYMYAKAHIMRRKHIYFIYFKLFLPKCQGFFSFIAKNILFLLIFSFPCAMLSLSAYRKRDFMFHKIKLIHGPNLNMLGIRQPEVYGRETLSDIEQYVVEQTTPFGFSVECFQSNSEGAIIDAIHACYNTCDGIILNAGAYTHYSYAIRDAIASVMLPCVEVHLSDIHSREPFRAISVIEPVCVKQICGMGKEGYAAAVKELLENHVR